MTGSGDNKEPARSERGKALARDREARRADALRENLKRRKAQARLRAAGGGDGISGAGEKDTGGRSA